MLRLLCHIATVVGYLINDQPSETVHIFKTIKNPNIVTCVLLCNACAQLGSEEAQTTINALFKTT